MTSMNNSFNGQENKGFQNSLRQQIYSKKVAAPGNALNNAPEAPNASALPNNVIPLQAESVKEIKMAPRRQRQIETGLDELYPSLSDAFQPQVTPLQGFGAMQPQHIPGAALYGQKTQVYQTPAEKNEHGIFNQIKAAIVDLIFEDVPNDQPIGLSQLNSATFNSTPDKPAGSFYTAPVTQAEDFRLNPFKRF